jgi:hypothetical protein
MEVTFWRACYNLKMVIEKIGWDIGEPEGFLMDQVYMD